MIVLGDTRLKTPAANTQMFVTTKNALNINGTFFFPISGDYGENDDAILVNVQTRVTKRGKIKNLRVKANANTLNSIDVIVLLVNGTPTALTITITTGSTAEFTDLVNEVQVEVGDIIVWRSISSATAGSINDIMVSAQIDYN